MTTITIELQTEEALHAVKQKYQGITDTPKKYPCVLAGIYTTNTKTGDLYSVLNFFYLQDKVYPDELFHPDFIYPKSFIKKMMCKYDVFLSNHRPKKVSDTVRYKRAEEYTNFLFKFLADYKIPIPGLVHLINDYGDDLDVSFCAAHGKMFILNNYCGVRGSIIFIPKEHPNVLAWVEEHKPDFMTKC